MDTNIEAAEQYVYANGRVLDRRRLEFFKGTGSAEQVAVALAAYQNPDGGFGHALEPDMRAPASEPGATMLALETLADVGAHDHPMVREAATWLDKAASPDGSLPQMMESGAGYPHAPFINPGGPTFQTFALAGALLRMDVEHAWVDRAVTWCWAELEGTEEPFAYTIEFALRFLDAVPDEARAMAALEAFRPHLDSDGCIPVPGGIEGERIAPLDLSPSPAARSRVLFAAEQLENDLDRLQRQQLEDGGWDFDFLHWSPGQALDWRGSMTVTNLELLRQHDRISW